MPYHPPIMRALAAGAALLAFAACSSGDDDTAPVTQPTVESTTSTTVDQAAADAQLIVGLQRSLSDAWFESPRAGVEATVAAQYPGTPYTVEQCIDHNWDGELPEGLRIESIVDQATIQPDPDWIVRGGPLDGLHPDGRTYIMSVHSTASAEGYPPQEDTSEVHATVLDGKAYIFSDCG